MPAALLSLWLLAAAQAAAPAPSDQFERGSVAFSRGEYGRAIDLLRPLLYPEIRLASEGEIVQAHRMLGVAHLFEKQNDRAAQEFRKLLQLRPDYRFEPLIDPPQVVDFFNGVLREHEAELAQLEVRRRDAEATERRTREAQERARNGPAVVEKRFARNSFAVNFIPFGAGQFQNGQRGKGWAFLATQSLLGSVSVAAFTTNFALYGIRPRRGCAVEAVGDTGCPQGQVDRTDEDRSRLLLRVQLVSGGLFFATVAWGIVDAVLNFTPEVPLVLTPTIVGDGLGAGLAFRF